MAGKSEVPRIVKLDESVVNRIAAGEVVQRPANAIKELLENSLDAGSTNIQVIIKQGGIKLLQIQDNGHGIGETDMPVVCERFTTSKLRKFEDLTQIATFGFRGEALASISHVARVAIATKTASSQCAYKANFMDGKMLGDLSFTAGNTGTQIIAEDMFYNMPTRRSALQNFGEEARRICEVMQKYAIHNYKVAISLRRFDENVPDVRTCGGASSDITDAIRNVYGNEISKKLLPVLNISDPKFGFSASVRCTSADYAGKKMKFLLFINNRLVECLSLKKLFEQIYSIYLPRNVYPFIYVSLSILPQNLDVNVHPTKQQVHFLFEDEIIDMIKRAVDSSLASSNVSRSFKVDTFSSPAPSNLQSSQDVSSLTRKRPSVSLQQSFSLPRQPPAVSQAQHSKIRVDSAQQKLDRFFNSKESSTPPPLSSFRRQVPNRQISLVTSQNECLDDSSIIRQDSTEVDSINKDESVVKESGLYVNEMYPGNISFTANSTIVTEEIGEDVEEMTNLDITNVFQKPKSSSKSMESVLSEKPNNSVSEISDGIQDRVEKKSTRIEPIVQTISNTKTKEVEVQEKQGERKTYINQNVIKGSIQKRTFDFDSLKHLKAEIESKVNESLNRIFSNFSFVGCIDDQFSLIQNDASLLMIDHSKIAAEFFYQAVLNNFGNMGFIRFEEPLPLVELASIALNSPLSGWKHEDGTKEELSLFCRDFLLSKAAMLLDYFSVEMNVEEGYISSIPMIIPDYIPEYAKLPFFILRLACNVNWDNEKACFQTVAQELSQFYAPGGMEGYEINSERKKDLEHTLFHHIKQQSSANAFLAPDSLNETACVVEVTSLHELYKVFERC